MNGFKLSAFLFIFGFTSPVENAFFNVYNAARVNRLDHTEARHPQYYEFFQQSTAKPMNSYWISAGYRNDRNKGGFTSKRRNVRKGRMENVIIRGNSDDDPTGRLKLLQRFFRDGLLQQPNFNSIPIQVRIKLVPVKIQDLIERNEVLETTLRVQLMWPDERLAWNPEDYSGLNEIVIPADTIWCPDIAILNSVYDVYHVVRDKRFDLKVRSDGYVWWHPTGIVRTHCKLFLRFFPFDTQRCSIFFESPTLDIRFMNLTLKHPEKPVDTRMFHDSETWKVTHFGGRNIRNQVGSDTVFTRVEFVIFIKRANIYHLVNFILPSIILSCIQILFFLLPSSHPQRVGSTTTILLSVIVFQTVVVSQLPKTSNDVPLLSVYIFCVIIVSSLSVSASVFMSKLVEYFDTNRPLPFWVHSIPHYSEFWRHRAAPRSPRPENPIPSSQTSSAYQVMSAPLAEFDSIFKLSEAQMCSNYGLSLTPNRSVNLAAVEQNGQIEMRVIKPDRIPESTSSFRPLIRNWMDFSQLVDNILMVVAILIATLSPLILFVFMPNLDEIHLSIFDE